ncbi:MAG: hypothetical protein NTW14_12115 [bacterium]|nr:hypothetical protein [bacterium]
MKPDCKPFIERLCESLGEDLSSPLCRELREHLDHCPDCSLQIDSLKRTIDIYRCLPVKEIPGDVEKRLWKRLHLPEVQPGKRQL